MQCRIISATVVLLVLLVAGCGEAPPVIDTQKTANEQAAKKGADRERAIQAQEKLAADSVIQEDLRKDFELLRGHWDHPGGIGSDGQPRPSLHLEITPNQVARFHMVSGVADSSTECPIRLTGDGERRCIVQANDASQLQLAPLEYRIDGDKLTLHGSASDVLLKKVDLSGDWRRTEWTKKSEPEIADALKRLDATIGYDDDNPSKPIVQVAFKFQAPVYNENLRILAGLKRLQDLDLSAATNVSDAGLQYLVSLKQLKQLNLTGRSVSDEAVQDLARQLPNCRIIR